MADKWIKIYNDIWNKPVAIFDKDCLPPADPVHLNGSKSRPLIPKIGMGVRRIGKWDGLAWKTVRR